jgi:hypothetical protein
MTTSEFDIRVADRSDRDDVIRLMGNIYSGDMRSRYDWMYQSNPHGEALTWLAVERASGLAVGCTSIFPRKVIVNGRERMGGIGGDCVIEPRVRRRGLATALHAASFRDMRERGIDFMYGPPTPNNLGALVKAGSRVVAGYRRWVRPLTAGGAYRAAFARVPSRIEAGLAYLPVRVFDRLAKTDASGYTLEAVESFCPAFARMFDRAQQTHTVVCARDPHYLAWRYFGPPSRQQTPYAVKREGETVGFVALEIAGESAAIADLFSANDPKDIDAALQLAVECATRAGCSSLEVSIAQGSASARRLRRHGFIGRDERGFQVAVSEDDPQFDLLTSPTAWHFTESDQDMGTVLGRSAAD